MHIERNYNDEKTSAIQKIDSFLDGLMKRQFPGGVTVQNPSKTWTGDQMQFSFGIKQGWLINATITGQIRVSDNLIVMDGALPWQLKMFQGQIEQVINNQLACLFP